MHIVDKEKPRWRAAADGQQHLTNALEARSKDSHSASRPTSGSPGGWCAPEAVMVEGSSRSSVRAAEGGSWAKTGLAVAFSLIAS